VADLAVTVALMRAELETYGANGADTDRLLRAAEAAVTLAADWQSVTGDSPAHEATRSCGRQLEDLLAAALKEDPDA
jgi:Tfp pilus assembly protein PilX